MPDKQIGDAEAISPDASRTERARRLVLYDALSHEAMGILTTGVFLAGFAVAIGASNLTIGVLAAVPFLAQLLQIPAVFLIERSRSRRLVSVWSSGIGRCFLLGSAMAPFLGTDAGMAVLIGTLSVHQAMAAVSGCAWNSWMRDLGARQRVWPLLRQEDRNNYGGLQRRLLDFLPPKASIRPPA